MSKGHYTENPFGQMRLDLCGTKSELLKLYNILLGEAGSKGVSGLARYGLVAMAGNIQSQIGTIENVIGCLETYMDRKANA